MLVSSVRNVTAARFWALHGVRPTLCGQAREPALAVFAADNGEGRTGGGGGRSNGAFASVLREVDGGGGVVLVGGGY